MDSTSFGLTLKDALAGIDLSDSGAKDVFSPTDHYEIVSAVAYLLGAEKERFQDAQCPFDPELFERLEKNRNARIIRDLCTVRNCIERYYSKISKAIAREYRSVTSVPEYVPTEPIAHLSDEGIVLYRYNKNLNQFLIEVNRAIQDRINNCRQLFPLWLDWNYLKGIFIMPAGLTEQGLKAAAALYVSRRQYYPYRLYLNWPAEDQGNILYNDKKFVTLLYQWNGDEFTDLSKVSNVSTKTQANIHSFLEESGRTVIVVDCENSDPYRLCATLQSLPPDILEKIQKVILYDDVHASNAWDMLKNHISVPIEYILIERLKDNKSLADVKLTAGTCREFYTNNVDSFVLVSSDSDYYGMIEALPEARFLVLVEHEKTSYALKEALIARGIFYAYIDEFYSGNSTDLVESALFREMYRYLDDHLRVNINEMLDTAIEGARVQMTAPEKKQFTAKYLKNMRMSIDGQGNVTFRFR